MQAPDMQRNKPEALSSYLRRRMIDLYLDDRTREEARAELQRLALERGVSAEEASRLAGDALDRWPVLAA